MTATCQLRCEHGCLTLTYQGRTDDDRTDRQMLNRLGVPPGILDRSGDQPTVVCPVCDRELVTDWSTDTDGDATIDGATGGD